MNDPAYNSWEIPNSQEGRTSGPLPQYPVALTPEQVAAFTRVSASHSCTYSDVLRARILLLAHRNPSMHNAEIARRVGCCRDTVQVWRARWHKDQTLDDRPRSGGPRYFSPLQRAQVVALACTDPKREGKVLIKPWRHRSWMHATDPNFVERAGPVLDLYEVAPALHARGEAVMCTDEKPSIQAREGVDAPSPARPGSPCRERRATFGMEPCNSTAR
jgi:hypothetical protein